MIDHFWHISFATEGFFRSLHGRKDFNADATESDKYNDLLDYLHTEFPKLDGQVVIAYTIRPNAPTPTQETP